MPDADFNVQTTASKHRKKQASSFAV